MLLEMALDAKVMAVAVRRLTATPAVRSARRCRPAKAAIDPAPATNAPTSQIGSA
jgi:hypothetical protein